MAKRNRRHSPALIFLALGDAVVVVACGLLAWRLQLQLWLAYLIGINVVTLLAYAYDKFASRSDWTRTPEWVLHFFAIVGGSPAALVGQQLFRHKTAKRSFQLWFWLIVGVQVIAAGVLLFLIMRGPR